MPELPEVETIKRELSKKIIGVKITDITINHNKVVKEPSQDLFKKQIQNSSIEDIIRRGKLLIFVLDKKFLIVHLRISGWLLYGEKDPKARAVFGLSNGKFLNYMDQRVLGELRLRSSFEDLSFLQRLGPEPFELTDKEFSEILKNKKTKIKVLLLDQNRIAGIGNIYAQEALFLAGIDPRRQALSLTEKEAKLLLKKIKDVLTEAIKYHGSSVDAYRDTEGKKGGMENRLKVYGRKGEPCYKCGRPIEKMSLGSRGTCFCKKCQR